MRASGNCRGLGGADYAGEHCRPVATPEAPVDPWSVRTRVVGSSCWRILNDARGLSHLPIFQDCEVRDVHEGDLGN